eukprot:m.97930 g.97930  ORF g.97930 m.97930 type:complete len:80 (+) comp36967_c1_seq9:315-554(+)
MFSWTILTGHWLGHWGNVNNASNPFSSQFSILFPRQMCNPVSYDGAGRFLPGVCFAFPIPVCLGCCQSLASNVQHFVEG